MAKVQTSAMFTDVKGKWNGSVFAQSSGGLYVRSQYGGGPKKTSKLQSAKTRFAMATSSWRNLSDPEREAWENSTELYLDTNVWGGERKRSGFDLFCAINIRRLGLGLDILTIPVNPVALPEITQFGAASFNYPFYAPDSVWSPMPLDIQPTSQEYINSDVKPETVALLGIEVDVNDFLDNQNISFNLYVEPLNFLQRIEEDYIFLVYPSGDPISGSIQIISLNQNEIKIIFEVHWGNGSRIVDFETTKDVIKKYNKVSLVNGGDGYQNFYLIWNDTIVQGDVIEQGASMPDFGTIGFSIIPTHIEGWGFAVIDNFKMFNHQFNAIAQKAIINDYFTGLPMLRIFIKNGKVIYTKDYDSNIQMEIELPPEFKPSNKIDVRGFAKPYIPLMCEGSGLEDWYLVIEGSYPSSTSQSPRSRKMRRMAIFALDGSFSQNVASEYMESFGVMIQRSTAYFKMSLIHPETGQRLELPNVPMIPLSPIPTLQQIHICTVNEPCGVGFVCLEHMCVEQAWYAPDNVFPVQKVQFKSIKEISTE